ncbi:MAG: nitronate monooxygenase [Candidimonas sp.]|nr:MAG: nitronate monooxygenase [Candidimonas sp.]
MSLSLKTKLCEQLNLRWPIVLAPMAGVSGGRLAKVVSAAGGLGMIGAGYADAAGIHQELKSTQPHKVGIGFITWYLARHPNQLDAALEHDLAAVMLSFGDAAPFAERVKLNGVPLILQVQTVAGAREAQALGADVIIAQGAEAGGHGARRGLFALLPAVVDAVSPTPVIAAGGIADGRGIAAALVLGASGALIGTRFYASREAVGHAVAKEALVRGSGDNTVRTRVFDIVRKYDWPEQYTGRALVNAFTHHWHGRENALSDALETETPAYWEAVRSGDIETAAVWASEGIDLIKSIEPADVLLARLVSEARRCLSASDPVR